jgi:hypothetical protein
MPDVDTPYFSGSIFVPSQDWQLALDFHNASWRHEPLKAASVTHSIWSFNVEYCPTSLEEITVHMIKNPMLPTILETVFETLQRARYGVINRLKIVIYSRVNGAFHRFMPCLALI